MVIDLAKTVKSTETGDLLSLVPDVTNFLDNFKQTLLDVYIKDYNGTSSGNGINEYGMVSTGSSNSFASDHGVHKADFVSSANSRYNSLYIYCLKKAHFKSRLKMFIKN